MSDEGEGTTTAPPVSLPNLDELRGDIGKFSENARRVERLWNRRFGAVALRSEVQYEHLRGLKDHYTHKRMWSYILMGMMGLLLVFQCVLLGLVGGGVWDFSAYDWLLPALMVQNLAAIIGLAHVVVRSLFRDQTESRLDETAEDDE